MTTHNSRAQPMSKTANRLFVEEPLAAGAEIRATPQQANYLRTVLRLRDGAEVLLFDGHTGEWRARVIASSRKDCVLAVVEQTRPQEQGPDLHYLFAPLKRARLDYMVEKATELGASVLRPVITRRTVVARVRLERLRAHAVEAAEQCGILSVPEIAEPQKLHAVLSGWDPARRLIYADEEAEVAAPLKALGAPAPGSLAVLVGPEGGFDPKERERLRALPFVTPISLGPRVMRADTAAVAALALVNAALGDWR